MKSELKSKLYRLRLFHKNKTEWTEWRELCMPFKVTDTDILHVNFTEPLTYDEAKKFFNGWVN